MPIEMPPVCYPETSALLLDNIASADNAIHATNAALMNDLVYFFGSLGLGKQERIDAMFRLMPEIDGAVRRDDPGTGIVVRVEDDGMLRMLVSSNRDELDAACTGRDVADTYVAAPVFLRAWVERQMRA